MSLAFVSSWTCRNPLKVCTADDGMFFLGTVGFVTLVRSLCICDLLENGESWEEKCDSICERLHPVSST